VKSLPLLVEPLFRPLDAVGNAAADSVVVDDMAAADMNCDGADRNGGVRADTPYSQ